MIIGGMSVSGADEEKQNCTQFIQIGLLLGRTWQPPGLFKGCLLTKILRSTKGTLWAGLMRYHKNTYRKDSGFLADLINIKSSLLMHLFPY